MGWTAIFDIVNKILPGREERLRNKIDELEKEKGDLLTHRATTRNANRIGIITDELRELKKKLQNR